MKASLATPLIEPGIVSTPVVVVTKRALDGDDRETVVGLSGRPVMPSFTFSDRPGGTTTSLAAGSNSHTLQALPNLLRVMSRAVTPDVPTMQEAGVPDFDVDSWYAMFVPAKTPRPVIDRLNQALNSVVNEPDILIADEPTTALDVTVQAQILRLLLRLRRELGMALMLITHDFGVVARLADDVVVMHGGRAVEHAPVEEVFDHPQDPYTVRLLDAVPRIDGPMRGLDTLPSSVAEHSTTGSPVLSVTDLTKTFAVTSRFLRRRTGEVQAVKGVSFDVEAGQTLAIVGESGSGKSTTLHEIMGFSQPPGVVRLTGVDPSTLRGRAARALRKQISIVFQDPAGALDPRMTARDVVAEPLRVAGRPRDEAYARVAELFEQVGLDSEYGQRFPRAFSGGQRQRLAIARALATEPAVIALDEPLSALDVSIQADILDLLMQVQADTGVAYLLVAHDLAVVRRIAHRVAVMKSGEIVEMGTVADIFERPEHPYTRSLIAAVPPLDPRRARVEVGT